MESNIPLTHYDTNYGNLNCIACSFNAILGIMLFIIMEPIKKQMFELCILAYELIRPLYVLIIVVVLHT